MSEKANTVVALRASTTRHEKEGGGRREEGGGRREEGGGRREEGGGRREEGQKEGGKEVRYEVH